jgi:hypothetical protein
MTDRRVRTSGRKQPVEDAIVLKHFLAARLDALAARAVERCDCLLDQPEIDATPGEPLADSSTCLTDQAPLFQGARQCEGPEFSVVIVVSDTDLRPQRQIGVDRLR